MRTSSLISLLQSSEYGHCNDMCAAYKVINDVKWVALAGFDFTSDDLPPKGESNEA